MPRYQVLDPKSLKKYNSSQIDPVRGPKGEVYLKSGIKPKPGTTKVVEQPASVGTVVTQAKEPEKFKQGMEKGTFEEVQVQSFSGAPAGTQVRKIDNVWSILDPDGVWHVSPNLKDSDLQRVGIDTSKIPNEKNETVRPDAQGRTGAYGISDFTIKGKVGFEITPQNLEREFQNYSGRAQEFQRAGVPLGQQTADLPEKTELPDFIKNDPEFQKLPDKEKELARTAWKAAHTNDVLRKIIADKALSEAIKIADPIFKQQLLLAKDESERNLAVFLTGNTEAKNVLNTKLANLKEDIVTNIGRMNSAEAESKIQDLESLRIISDQAIRESSSREAGVAAELARTQRRIDAISDDLKVGKQDISLEEQAALSRQLREYQRNLQSTQEQAVDAGLGFSSIRAQAEQRLLEDLADVSESTKRQSSRQIRLLETSSGRDTTELVAGEAEIKRKNQAERVDIARQIEQKYGFDAIPTDIKNKILAFEPTFAPIGVRGNLTAEQQRRETELQQKQQDLNLQQKRAQAEVDTQIKSLEKEREQKVLDIQRAKEKAVGTSNLTVEDKALAKPLGEIKGVDITGTLELERKRNIVAEQQAIIKAQPVI